MIVFRIWRVSDEVAVRSTSLNKSRGCHGRLRSAIKARDSGYSSGFTLFYYFHFIVLICVRVRYLRARSLSRAPPTARRPIARGSLTRYCRARTRARCDTRPRCHAAAAHHTRTDIATMLIVSNYSYFVLVRSTSPVGIASHRAIISMSSRILWYWLRFHSGHVLSSEARFVSATQ